VRNTQKKVAQKKIFGFSEEALSNLNDMKQRTGKTETQIIEDLLAGRDRFKSGVESLIASTMQARGLRRDEAIEALIEESIPASSPSLKRVAGVESAAADVSDAVRRPSAESLRTREAAGRNAQTSAPPESAGERRGRQTSPPKKAQV
jgi:hypothetical protein